MNINNKYEKYTWKQEYETDVKFIDNFHKNFMKLINTLIDVVYNKECSEKIIMVFHRLANYIEDYLVKEEMYLQEIGYENLMEHKAEHKAFIKEIISFQEAYENQQNICLDLLVYVDKYFKNHILKGDKNAVNNQSKN